MAALLDVIGVVSGLLGIYQFAADNFASSDKGGSVVRVQVGLDNPGGLSNAGGDLPDVRLFNEVGDFLGASYDPGHIDDGTNGKDITVTQTAEQQATYGLFTANDDAICIAYLSIVWPDEQKFGWTGDWAQQCGLSWYYSNVVVDGKKPACMWIDANHDQPITAFQLHFADFVSNDGNFAHDTNYYCSNSTSFATYTSDDPNSIVYIPPQKAKSKSKRRPTVNGEVSSKSRPLQRRDDFVDERLVISNDPTQNTDGLCSDPASLGPDLLNVAEGRFCQMSTKTVHPVCSDTVTDDCFNVDTQKLILGGVSTRDDNYSKVIDWTGGS